MREFAAVLLVLAGVSPFVALFIGPVIARDPAGSLYFFPVLALAIPVGLGALIALLLAPRRVVTGKRPEPSRSVQSWAAALSLLLGTGTPVFWLTVGRDMTMPVFPGERKALAQVCAAKARTDVFKTVSGVEEVAIRLPLDIGQRTPEMPRLIETPAHFADTAHRTWLEGTPASPAFKRAVILVTPSSNDLNKTVTRQLVSRPGDYPFKRTVQDEALPRYELTWDNIQTYHELRTRLAGVTAQVRDRETGEVLARKTTYFLRKESGSAYIGRLDEALDGCGNAVLRREGSGPVYFDNSREWVRQVLLP
jgi:hypothetical protein